MNEFSWTRFELWPWALVTFALALVLAARGLAVVGQLRRQLHWTLLTGGRESGGKRRAMLRAAALTAFAVALLGPAYGFREEKVVESTRPVLLAVDYSLSMRATDVAPDRLTRMREVVGNLMNSFPQYKYGLVVFAADARYRVPYTYDRDFIRFVLDETQPEDVSPQGTDLRRPLEMAIRTADLQQLRDATLVLITDGEHTGNDDPADMVALLRDRGIRVLAVGIGDPGGAPIPLAAGGYVKDRGGQMVYSKPDIALLDKLATGTGGIAYEVTGRDFDLNPLAALLTQINAARGSEIDRRTAVDRAEWPIGLGCLLFALSLLPLPILGKRDGGAKLTDVRAAVAVAVLVAGMGCQPDSGARQDLESGRAADAAAWYADRAAKTGDPAALANLGQSLTALENYPAATTAFLLAATRETNSSRRGDDIYNAANAYFKAGDLQKAIELYEAALAERDDEDTQYNLEVAKRLLAQLEQQQQQQNQDQQQEQQEGSESAEPQPAGGEPQEDEAQQGQAPQAGQPDSEAASEEEPEIGVMLERRIEQLEESNPAKLKGKGIDHAKPW